MWHLGGAGAADPLLACLRRGISPRKCLYRQASLFKAATMHLAITHILLVVVMLTGEMLAIPLQGLEQSGCLEFIVSLFSPVRPFPRIHAWARLTAAC